MRGKENGFCPSRVHLVSRKKWTLKNAACVKSFKENSVYYGGDSTSLLTAFEVTVMYILHICSAVTELLKCLSLVLFNRGHIAKRPADMRSTKSSGHKKRSFLICVCLIALSLFYLSMPPNRFLVEPEIPDIHLETFMSELLLFFDIIIIRFRFMRR